MKWWATAKGDRVHIGFLPLLDVGLTLAACSRVDCGGQMYVGAMVLPGPLQHPRAKRHAQYRDAA